ncbi:dolichyl pyrophosphate phosphatase [Moelleriella libera RCEF 2490]|uniref:Dolichyldiphosphatase n=1 Tax=Moelleriella libera RCEF 2490 TaxID=1081109 RepID=A0A168CET1_9HYPO|nr:dolichyl pyrophosphate phosphatase [Moelleriella libera RCEF 2490]
MSDDTAPLASLSLTHVYYDANDPVSLFCAYLALLPQALCVVYATLILATREFEIISMFLGQAGCEVINFALKRLIKEERPRKIHGKGYGMPSSHAQFVAFWSVSLALFLLVRHKPTSQGRTSKIQKQHQGNYRAWSFLERLAVSICACVVAAAVAWSRIYLNYHTPKQVAVGSLTGVAVAMAWFEVVSWMRRTGWLAWGLGLPIVTAFRVRDLIVSEDMCQAGWEKWQLHNASKAKTG